MGKAEIKYLDKEKNKEITEVFTDSNAYKKRKQALQAEGKITGIAGMTQTDFENEFEKEKTKMREMLRKQPTISQVKKTRIENELDMMGTPQIFTEVKTSGKFKMTDQGGNVIEREFKDTNAVQQIKKSTFKKSVRGKSEG